MFFIFLILFKLDLGLEQERISERLILCAKDLLDLRTAGGCFTRSGTHSQ